MRTKLFVLAAVAAFVFAGTAKADTISVIWQGSGTATTSAASSASITANLILTVSTTDQTLINWSVEWDLDAADELDFVTSASGGGPATDVSIFGQGNTAGNPGQQSSYGYSTFGAGALAPGTYTAGTITFHVTGNVSALGGIDVEPTFNNTPAGDGCGTTGALFCTGRYVLNGATVNPAVIPEPGTVALLALGLAGLGLVGHRSRR